MKILVTGARGFIGHWLVRELKDHDVVGVDKQDGDLTVPRVFTAQLDALHPDVVIHLAAQASVLYCEENPFAAVVSNAGMTSLVARECGHRGIRLVYASTSEVYGDRLGLPCSEDGPLGKPLNLYALTKLWGEQACFLYTKDPLILRLSMPYGPLQETTTSPRLVRHRAAVINFLWQALHRQPMPVHLGSERSLCWIGDTVRAIRMLAETNRTGIWNVGRDDQLMTVLEIAKAACELAGAPKNLIELREPPGYRTRVKNLSMQKLRTIGWTPEVSLEEGMRRTLEWVKTLPPPEQA